MDAAERVIAARGQTSRMIASSAKCYSKRLLQKFPQHHPLLCFACTEPLWAALRYTESNPVRARIVEAPDQYRWSSAALHCGGTVEPLPVAIDLDVWRTVSV